jgi:multidrug efflux pump subunit AcrB
VIRWFAAHPTAANLLLVLFLAAGAIALPTLKRETFPDFRLVEAEIAVAYRGATAADVEDTVCRRLGDALAGLEALDELVCVAEDDRARAVATMLPGGEAGRFLDDIRTATSAIDDLPATADPPLVRELHRTDLVAAIAVAGPMRPEHLERYATAMQDRLRALPGVGDVTLAGFGARQLRIEVPRDVLRQHGLTASDLATIVGAQSVDRPAGTLETTARDVRLRVTEERRNADELARLVISSGTGGGEVTLGEIATITEAFAPEEERSTLDGERAAILDVHKARDADALVVLDRVAALIEAERAAMPPSVRLEIVQDMTSIIRDRLAMLVRNGAIGLVLVVLMMSVFFRPGFALWAAMGLPVAFLGAFVAMAAFGLSLNMITLVALLMAIGIVMDDSVVIADSVAGRVAEGAPPLEAAVEGTRRVLPGIISSFLTTVAVFAPLSFLAGQLGAVLQVLPLVLIAALAASLAEAFLILPHHLRRAVRESAAPGPMRARFERGFGAFRDRGAGRVADLAIARRYLVAGLALAALVVTVGLLASGRIAREAFPEIDGDVLEARILMPQGTPLARTEVVVDHVTAALAAADAGLARAQPGGAPLVRSVRVQFNRNATAGESGPHVATISADLTGAGTRTVTLDEIAARWRAEIGPLPGIVALTIDEPGIGPQGIAVEIRLVGSGLAALAEAADALQAELETYVGVFNALHDLRPGKPELRLRMADGAHQAGVTAADIAGQLRAAFLGTIVATVHEGALTYEIELRQSAADRTDLADFTITLPGGAQAPLATVASIEEGRGWARITHLDGQRTATVQASVDGRLGNADAITRDLAAGFLPDLAALHSGLSFEIAGQAAASEETSRSILRGFLIGLVGIYVVLSFQFRSYVEPLVVMVTIPLAFLGAVWGHALMGYNISMPSLVGAASLAGIVVNNAILLVQATKTHAASGLAVAAAAGRASRDRFRPILVSSSTTIIGILPLLTETSTQAQALKPLVISVAFGLFTATVLVLIVLPSLYAILDDLRTSPSSRGATAAATA